MQFEDLKTIKQISAANPAFSEAGLRWMVFNARTNGLDSVIHKVGNRVLIDVRRFNAWLDRKRLSESAD